MIATTTPPPKSYDPLSAAEIIRRASGRPAVARITPVEGLTRGEVAKDDTLSEARAFLARIRQNRKVPATPDVGCPREERAEFAVSALSPS